MEGWKEEKGCGVRGRGEERGQEEEGKLKNKFEMVGMIGLKMVRKRGKNP